MYSPIPPPLQQQSGYPRRSTSSAASHDYTAFDPYGRSNALSPAPSIANNRNSMASTYTTGSSMGPSAGGQGMGSGMGVSDGLLRGPLMRQAGGNPQAPCDDEDDPDDYLHAFTPSELARHNVDTPFMLFSWRGWANMFTLFVMGAGLVMIFAGWPILSWWQDTYGGTTNYSATAGYNIGGINASGQYPEIAGLPKMIDDDTPSWAYTREGHDGGEWQLVFSDEFEKEGRTFFEGDDPFFTAVDIHYWATGDFEWLDPSAVTTKDGHLVMTMTQEPIHDLNFKSGMVQSWNKLCFNKNAFIEVSASFPGVSDIGGFWPGIWTMGNLGRPGYGASTQGLWPYSYDSCDVGILENQTYTNGTGPTAALNTGSNSGQLSVLPGMRTPSCTCEGEDHPGPNVRVGRAAPEIDIIEAQIVIVDGVGQVSQSLQLAPFDDYYQYDNTSVEQYNTSITSFNSYLGGTYQQAASSLTTVPSSIYYNQDDVEGYEGESGQFAMFGLEYQAFPDERDRGYITWYSDNKTSWTVYADAIKENTKTEVGRRIIPEEPMALIFNLHMSNNFQNVDFSNLKWPNYHRIDYVRVYQKADRISVTCDPEDYPTADYIANHLNVYSNPNLTTWAEGGYENPKNALKDGC
ncbi:glucosidase [Cryptococcus wingfieldii CBS 7118]|uniref:Glucosidase n=1 Tax=Cryptococcus wingfieldii CBS 7118 TaxID=1295528 RepID=A0A1E3HJ78_9TREE|nr:glucosidase [Cryptococcus wingfieldii CBS 7118]ODN76410.1 glucosidase [Cryptococcus wingfieldii CBS 7118]